MKNEDKAVMVSRVAPSIAAKLDAIIADSPIKTNRSKLIEKLICMHVAENEVRHDEIDSPIESDEVESNPTPIITPDPTPPQPASVPATVMMVEEEVDVDDLDVTSSGEVEFVDDVDDDFDSEEDTEEESELAF